MKKMMKQYMIFFMVGLLLFTMIGCGSESSKEESNGAATENKKDDTKKDDTNKEEATTVDVDSNINLDGERIVQDTITITATGRQGATKDWQNTIQLEQYKERFGIDIQTSPYSNDSWNTQFTLMLSTNELTDIVVNTATNMAEINKYGGQGYFLPLNDYLEFMPNFQAKLDENPAWKAAITAPDGNIYGISKYNIDPIRALPRTYFNEVWLKNVGMEEPQTIEELYDVLKAFKEQDANGNGDPNDEIPMAYNTDFYWYSDIMMLSAFGLTAWTPDYFLAEIDGTVELGNITENYKEYLKYMKKLYADGLLDQEGFIQTRQEVEAKAGEDRYGLVGCPSAPFAFAKKDKSFDRNWTMIGGLPLTEGAEASLTLNSDSAASAAIAVNVDTEYPIEIARMIDFMCTDEGILSGTHGFVGQSFEYKDVKGTPVADLYLPDGYKSQGEYRQQKAVIQSALWIMSGTKGYPADVVLNLSDDELEAVKADENEEVLNYWMLLAESLRRKDVEQKKIVPNLIYTEDENDKASTLKTDITTYIQTAKAQFITGEIDIEQGWDNYVSTLQQMGLGELLEIEKTAYERMSN